MPAPSPYVVVCGGGRRGFEWLVFLVVVAIARWAGSYITF